jgi:hypothetical protein
MQKLFIIGPVARNISSEARTVGEKLEEAIAGRLEREQPRAEYGEGKWRIDSITTTYATFEAEGAYYDVMTATILAHDDFSEFY